MLLIYAITQASSSIEKLFAINRSTGIETRAVTRPFSDPFWDQESSPSISDLEEIFRTDGVNLATEACKKTLQKWKGRIEDISHTVAVTCTNTSNPGFDLTVAKNLGLKPDVERTLLHGVGCAGGLAAMRVAANIACGATQRHNPARILVFASEICSIHLRCDLDAMTQDEMNFSIAATLFSDGAASFIMCNELGSDGMTECKYSVLNWKTAVLADSQHHMSFLPCSSGTSNLSVITTDDCELTVARFQTHNLKGSAWVDFQRHRPNVPVFVVFDTNGTQIP